MTRMHALRDGSGTIIHSLESHKTGRALMRAMNDNHPPTQSEMKRCAMVFYLAAGALMACTIVMGVFAL